MQKPLPKIMRKVISRPKYHAISGCWDVVEGEGAYSSHNTEEAAWEWIERLGALGHSVPERKEG